MRCLQCGAFSFNLICKNCSKILGEISLQSRMAGDLKVYYFYHYDEIKPLILAKHKMHGSALYKRLAMLSFTPFARLLCSNFEILNAELANFNQTTTPIINAIALDDNVNTGYSHTAILARPKSAK